MLISEAKNELLNHIIPFWDALRDDEYGGFYGQMDNDLNLDKKGGKGVILNSRILWFLVPVALLGRISINCFPKLMEKQVP